MGTAISDEFQWLSISLPILKWGFHTPTTDADERYKTADLWDFEKIFGQCYRFLKSADHYY